MKELVRLGTRPSRDGRTFTYLLDYKDENGKRKRIALGHADKRKAQRQRDQLERELRMGVMAPGSMKLTEFLEDSMSRTGNQIRESTRIEYESAMKDFISVVGDIDYQAVQQRHGEIFVRACMDRGNRPATVAKKLRELKRIFQLAVDRGQLEVHPLRRLRPPKSPRQKIRTYSDDECGRILKAAVELQPVRDLRWDLLILMAMTTGMRKSELLNAVWSDIDFSAKTIEVQPKKNTLETWEWQVKDCDCRTLPLTEEVVILLAEVQNKQPEGYPYVFVPPARYEHIQSLRQMGKWTLSRARLKVINNFTRDFRLVLSRASVRQGQFHDLRRTALSSWFANGMREHDVMTLAGHADFSTTNRFYLSVSDGLIDRARNASAQTVGNNLARTWHAPLLSGKKD
jgi:integrase